ncbi:MAG: cell division protein FtsQ/DivIB [Saprospiraceae bacterium]
MKQSLQSTRLWRSFFVGALVAAFTFAGYAGFTRLGNRVVDVVVDIQPTPTGNFLIEGSDIQKRLDAGPHGALIGQSIDKLELSRLEEFLLEDPFVANADIYTGFDGKLNVSIIQCQPILRVHHRTGNDYYLGPNGEVLPLSKHDFARVPVLTGDVPSFKEAISDSLTLEVFVLAKAIDEDVLLSALIEQIDFRRGEYVLVPKMGSADITLGGLDELDDKLHKLKAYIQGVLPEKGWDAYENVDLRYDNQVIGTANEKRSNRA